MLARIAACAMMLGGAAAGARGQWTFSILGPAGLDSTCNGGICCTGPNPTGGGLGAQVGYVLVPTGTGGATQYHAALWNGTAASFVDLHPPGAASSVAFGVANLTDVPVGRTTVQVGGVAVLGAYHAALWPVGGTVGVPAWLDLNPIDASASLALCVMADGAGGGGPGSTKTVGFATYGLFDHAGMWRGTDGAWTDLHPSGPGWPNITHSHAVACDGVQEVGYVTVGTWHATLWSGSAASAVDLHPAGATRSECAGVWGGTQVGNAIIGGVRRAMLWRGSAQSAVDLHPAQTGASASVAMGVYGPWQAGDVTIGGVHRASVWNGSAGTWQDLSVPLGNEWLSSYARAIWLDGQTLFVAGEAIDGQTGREVAILWRRTMCCAADFDCSGGPSAVNVADIFDFLGAWFAGDPRADINRANGISVQDIFDFLSAWFVGC